MMTTNIKCYFWVLTLSCLPMFLTAQVETNCDPNANQPITQGEVIINYGSVTNSYSFKNRSSYTIAQPIVGVGVGQEYSSQTGFWSRFLLPPIAPQVTSSQGDFPDRVLVKWEVDPLSSTATDGFTISRDGAFLGQVDANIREFIDFNVQAGEFYNYTVYGKNKYGSGSTGTDLGFVNPNGTITGVIETFSGNAVAGAVVKLTPTIGKSLSFNGTTDNLCVTYNPLLPTDMFTASAWVKIGATHDSDGILDLGSDLNKNFWIKTTPALSGKGVVIGVGDGTNSYELSHEFITDVDDWHQVTAVYSAGSLLLYVDGSFVSSTNAAMSNEASLFTIGSNRNQTGFFDGKLDDVRIYNRPLTGSEIFLTKDITVSKATSGLVAYWKFDEGIGTKAFDITDNDIHAFINGATFSSDNGGIENAGTSDGSGFYSIESINYSTVQNFTARPSKIFYSNYALEFNKAYGSYAALTNFDIPDTATVETIIHPFDNQSVQSILSNGTNNFVLGINAGNFTLTLNGETKILGPATTSYQHLSLTLDGGTDEVAYYNNGTLINTLTFGDVTGDWSSTAWQLAAKDDPATDFFTGLIDEVSFYKAKLSQATIELNASPFGSGGTDVGNGDLIIYFDLNEGSNTIIADSGPAMTGDGTVYGANFSIITYKQEEFPHAFRPSSRVVNINPSNTAASGIDFIDESTVTISGVVRFENTFCYQESVELLVNGQSAFPPIFTDENGRFVGDFEPGVTVSLTPKYGSHVFSPGFFQVRNINRPIANILFVNQTKREVSGQIYGGLCKKSIVDPLTSQAIMSIDAQNGCYTQTIAIDNADGKFKFKNLPPIPFTVALVQHNDNFVKDYFDLLAGIQVDMRDVEKDTVDFIYRVAPTVFIQPFDETGCIGSGVKTIDQSVSANGYKKYSRDIKVFEEYYNAEICYLDSFDLIINNGISDQSQFSVHSDTSVYSLNFYAGLPRLGGDHTKDLGVTAFVNGNTASAVESVVVLGERSRAATFTTASPVMPLIILRDPPGDASSSSLSKGTTTCTTWSKASLTDIQTGLGLNIDLGAKVIAYAGSPFGGIITETEQVNEIDISATFGEIIGNETSGEVCVTNDVEYATSDGDAIVGGLADLYVGAAVNFEFSSTDILQYNPDSCDFTMDVGVKVAPAGFGTKYIYSEWQIISDVIPSLQALNKLDDVQAWEKIIKYNKDLKASAKFKENITFDALNVYSSTSESSTNNAYNFSHEITWSAAFNQTLGFEAFGLGSKVSLGFSVAGSSSGSNGGSTTNTRSVSYTLADDDPNDNYSVDILDDAVFGTPVFKVKAGETMCPWEPGTQNREQVEFKLGPQLFVTNVDENASANFVLQMTNDSQTGNDPLVYTTSKVVGTNPNGAGFLLDGSDFGGDVEVQINPADTKSFLLQVFKGPVEYTYLDMGVFMASTCQLEHSKSLGYDLSAAYTNPTSEFTGPYKTADLAKFYAEAYVSVEFLEPCSPIDISSPLQDWVQTPAIGNMRSITLDSYIWDDPDLVEVSVQYRRIGGNGVWIEIILLPKSEFVGHPVFKVVQWDMTNLQDGPYEIRAVTKCNSLALSPGISHIIRGRKETNGPELFGTPQPADGVLGPGDEISVVFSKRIDCDMIFQADGIGTNINLNNLALQDMTLGGLLIDATITCKDEKIVIVPKIQNAFIENHTLRVTATGILDLYGNSADQIVWEFFVNRSNLFWVGGDIDKIAMLGDQLEVKREIRNQSGEVTDFELYDVPDWVDVFPLTGTIQPGSSKEVTFSFPSDLVAKAYNQTINLSTQIGRETTPTDGNEPLIVDLRVACPAPEWRVNSADYSYSMNYVLELDIEGDLSEDKLDVIGAFVGSELRGVANIQFNADINKYVTFLTVYSNQATGELVEFQIWDASACQLFANIIETFSFVADDLVGSPFIPQVVHTDNQLLRKIHIHPGWNWISFNLDFPDPSVGAALSSLTNPTGSLIKGQSNFSSYSSMANDWFGDLINLGYSSLYQYNTSNYDSISMIGFPIDAMTPLPLVSGWNWIGYLPQTGQALNSALASLTPLNGDIIKSQLSFAVYVSGVGWIGNLNFLSGPNGYLLKLSNVDTLIYTEPENLQVTFQDGNKGSSPMINNTKTIIDITSPEEMPFSYWYVDPTIYEHSMNTIAIVVKQNDDNILNEGDEVGAFVGEEVRGSSKVIFIPQLESYMVFMTIYANQEGELVTFKFYDSSEDEVYKLIESKGFEINQIIGAVDDPQPLHLDIASATIDLEDHDAKLQVSPNPFASAVYVNYHSTTVDEIEVKIIDIYGHEVDRIVMKAQVGSNVVEWRPSPGIIAGTYFITMKDATSSYVQKVLYIK